MAQFRATISLSGQRAGEVIEADPADPVIAARVKAGFLVPMDGGGSAAPAKAPDVQGDPPKPNVASVADGATDEKTDGTEGAVEGDQRGRRR
jgi:hypothetical protein